MNGVGTALAQSVSNVHTPALLPMLAKLLVVGKVLSLKESFYAHLEAQAVEPAKQ